MVQDEEVGRSEESPLLPGARHEPLPHSGYIDDVNGYDFGNDDNTVHDQMED